MSTHIAAAKGQIAESILLPGDPLRAKFIAETFLEGPERFNDIRNMLGYTGTYGGDRVSVMGTGMGMPSLSIYVNELIKDYGVKRLVRVGTCGGLTTEVKVRDMILGISASTDSAINKVRFRGMDYAPAPSFRLLEAAYRAAKERKMPVHVGKVVSSDSSIPRTPTSGSSGPASASSAWRWRRRSSTPSRPSTASRPSPSSRSATISSRARRPAPPNARRPSSR